MFTLKCTNYLLKCNIWNVTNNTPEWGSKQNSSVKDSHFKYGKISIDDPFSDQPATSITDEIVSKVEEIIHFNYHLTVGK